MGYTKFGEFMRVLRVKNHEVMGDTAKLLNVKVPFVSAVESGKRNVPEGWVEILTEHYDLDENQRAELQEAIEESKTQVKVNLIQATDIQRRVALQFQRSFDNLDEKTANELLKILDKEKR